MNYLDIFFMLLKEKHFSKIISFLRYCSGRLQLHEKDTFVAVCQPVQLKNCCTLVKVIKNPSWLPKRC